MRFLIVPFVGAALFAQAPAPQPDVDQDKNQATEPRPMVIVPSQPGDAKPAEKLKQRALADLREKFKQAMRAPSAVSVAIGGKIALAPGQACAIPLKNVLPEGSAMMDKKMTIPLPPKNGRLSFTMREVTPPAPSCDDVKR